MKRVFRLERPLFTTLLDLFLFIVAGCIPYLGTRPALRNRKVPDASLSPLSIVLVSSSIRADKYLSLSLLTLVVLCLAGMSPS
jgi:hypothetical protein